MIVSNLDPCQLMGVHMFISLITFYLSASGSNGPNCGTLDKIYPQTIPNGPVEGTLEQWGLMNPEDGGLLTQLSICPDEQKFVLLVIIGGGSCIGGRLSLILLAQSELTNN